MLLLLCKRVASPYYDLRTTMSAFAETAIGLVSTAAYAALSAVWVVTARPRRMLFSGMSAMASVLLHAVLQLAGFSRCVESNTIGPADRAGTVAVAK